MSFKTLTVRREEAVLFVEILAPPMNLLGPELVRDLVSLIQQAEADESVQVLLFTSGDPDFFVSHVDVNRVKEYRAEAANLVGEASIALLFRHLSASRLVTIAQVEGRVRGAGSELVLACDMSFAARETAIFGQFEPAFGSVPGGGATQHLARLMGRARAMEVLLTADDYDAEMAERYGWINRALPAAELGDFVKSLAHRIARLPAAGHLAVKNRVNAITLAPVEDFRRDSDLFGESNRQPEVQSRQQAAMKHGFQTREGELELGRRLGELNERPVKHLQTIAVEHVTISSERPFPEVRRRLEESLPKLDASIAEALRSGDQKRATEYAERGPQLSIFETRDIGSLLETAGRRRNALQYEIGNPVTASKMTRYQLAAALYTPLRVVLFEDEGGKGVFQYDRPASFFGQFGDGRVTAVGRELDVELEAALRNAAD